MFRGIPSINPARKSVGICSDCRNNIWVEPRAKQPYPKKCSACLAKDAEKAQAGKK
jgi:hypothetical protein